MAIVKDFVQYNAVRLIRVIKFVEYFLAGLFFNQVKVLVTKIFRVGKITLNGKNPCDPRIHNDEFYLRVGNNASMGLGETYMEGMWNCDDIPDFVHKVMTRRLYRFYLNKWNRLLNWLQFYYFNNQTQDRAWEVGKKHYDTGNDLFESFLDSNMQYSCGYWRTATNLNQAQIDKMELIAKKLMLKPGMTVLDIGCGWGGLASYIAKQYEVKVCGITISEEQAKFARKRCAGLPVDIRLMDYRNLDEQFDRIVSVGMFEHVGHHNYREFFNTAHKCLKNDGLFLLHTIGVNNQDMTCVDPWAHTYIFPNGYIPYYKEVTDKIEGLFIIEDWQNFGHDYSKTLKAWHENFEKSWPKLSNKYGDKFFRMWSFYLLSAQGMFTSRKLQLWQVVLTKNGYEGGYYAAR